MRTLKTTPSQKHKPEYELAVKDIPCLCIIGILPNERKNEQPLFITVRLWGEFHRVASTGNLSHGVDYSILQNDYQQILKLARFMLIETAALALCEWTFWRYSSISRVQISIVKPQALRGQGTPEIMCTLKHRTLKAPYIIKTPEIEIYEGIPKVRNVSSHPDQKITLIDGHIVLARVFP
jgi:dihydroneopterin aldolase